MRNRWISLPRFWKTEQAYQVMNLLEQYHISARTMPDEFNGSLGNRRMLTMDRNTLWPVYIRAKYFEKAIAILAEEQLL